MASESSEKTKTGDTSDRSSRLSEDERKSSADERKSSADTSRNVSEDKSASSAASAKESEAERSRVSSQGTATSSGGDSAALADDDNPPLPQYMFGRIVLPYSARTAIQHLLILLYIACILAMGYAVVMSGFSIFDAVKVAPTLPTMHKVMLILIVLLPAVCVWLGAGYAINVLYGLHVRQLQRAVIVIFNVSIFLLVFYYFVLPSEEKDRHARILPHLLYTFKSMREGDAESIEAVNFMQGEFQCCGVVNPRSWHAVGGKFTRRIFDQNKLSIPWSCCIRDLQNRSLCGNGLFATSASDAFDSETLFATGCDAKLEEMTNDVVKNIRFIIPKVAWPMVFSALLLLYLANAMKYLYAYCETDVDTAVTWICACGKAKN